MKCWWKDFGGLWVWKLGMRIWIQAKFPKEQFIAMDEYTATVKFPLSLQMRVFGTLSDFGEHLSFTFLIAALANRRGGFSFQG